MPKYSIINSKSLHLPYKNWISSERNRKNRPKRINRQIHFLTDSKTFLKNKQQQLLKAKTQWKCSVFKSDKV